MGVTVAVGVPPCLWRCLAQRKNCRFQRKENAGVRGWLPISGYEANVTPGQGPLIGSRPTSGLWARLLQQKPRATRVVLAWLSGRSRWRHGLGWRLPGTRNPPTTSTPPPRPLFPLLTQPLAAMSFQDIETGRAASPRATAGTPQSAEDAAFAQLQSSLALQVFKINANVQGILKLVDQLGTPRDAPGLRKSLCVSSPLN